MNPDLPAETAAFETAAGRAFDDLGGVDFARRAEADPTRRSEAVRALDALGADGLDPRDGDVSAGAAAVLCRAAGAVALPYPIEAMSLRGRTSGRPFAVVAAPARRRGATRDAGHDAGQDPARADRHAGRAGEPPTVRVDHGDLAPTWDVATLDGPTGTASASPPDGGRPLRTELGPFCVDLVVDRPVTAGDGRGAAAIRRSWWLTLTSWRILGGLEHAVELAARHTSERVQFDKPLTAFQTVRFALADASVAVSGLGELARYTLWRLVAEPGHAFGDALALRCHAVDVAREVLRTTQHLHGATGLCDEADISILVRHLQPSLRLPESADATAHRLAAVIDDDGFSGLFPHGSAA